MKNYTAKEVNDLLDEYSKEHYGMMVTREELEQFKKDKGLPPTLEVGKWYKHPNEHVLTNFTDIRNNQAVGYGFNYLGDWVDVYTHGNISTTSIAEATHKEVEEALIAEAKRRGFKEGVSFKCLVYKNAVKMRKDEYVHKLSWDRNEELRDSYGSCLFYDGKWAEITDTEPEELKEAVIEAWKEGALCMIGGTGVGSFDDEEAEQYYTDKYETK